MSTNKSRLVFGLGGGLVASFNQDRNELVSILNSFENNILISTIDMPYNWATVIYNAVGKDRLFLDSGGFTLYKEQIKYGFNDVRFIKSCEKIKRKFLKMLTVAKYDEIFELDNEYFRYDDDPLSPKNYLRQEVKDICGFYPTPVFKMFQGFEYWKNLCDSPLYPKLAIGGLAQTRDWGQYRDELQKMMAYAKLKGKKVHLLGCRNVDTCRFVSPSTVDYSIFQYAINLNRARKEHPELKTYAELKKHASLYAFATALSNDYLYNARNVDFDD